MAESEDGGSTMEMPAFDESRATLEEIPDGVALQGDGEERSGDDILLTEADEVPLVEVGIEESVEVPIDAGPEPEEPAAEPTMDEEAPAEANFDDAADEDAGEEDHEAEPEAGGEPSAAEEATDEEDEADDPPPAPAAPAVVQTASVVVVSRMVAVQSAPGAVAPPPPEPEPDTLVGADVDLDEPEIVVDEASDDDDELDDSEDDDLEVDLEPPSAPELEVAPPDSVPDEEIAAELLEVADVDSGEIDPKPASKPPPPPGKLAAPPPPPEPEAKPKAKPAAAAVKPKRKPRRQWWDGLFNDDYLRTVPIPTPRTIETQCDFIEQRFGLAPGATLLDVGCGLGLHAVELTRRGYLVVGLDLSLPMLSRAADEAQEHGFKINFLHADMREMNFDGAFDAVLCWGTTFGYFDDEGNRQVVERLYRALKPRGLLLLEVVNRDYVIQGQPNLVWFEGDGCVVMEETAMNYITSRLEVKRTVILDDGRQRDARYTLRLYSLHELGQVLHHRGFRVVEVSGREAHPGVYFGADSPKLIILAERRPQGSPPPARENGAGSPPTPPKDGDSDPDGQESQPVTATGSTESPEPAAEAPEDPSSAVSEALADAIEQSEEELAELLEADLEPSDESE
ncbi:MAG: class I SAM-dependent methyltransferase [Sandaracinaceae bacterium]|nr:class I SAM-dependent methyltransferase [Sandaracinaceae bacterium]